MRFAIQVVFVATMFPVLAVAFVARCVAQSAVAGWTLAGDWIQEAL